MNPLLNIFFLSLFAGLCTGIGGIISLVKKPKKNTFGLFMGFAVGVMLTLSFFNLMKEAIVLSGILIATLSFG